LIKRFPVVRSASPDRMDHEAMLEHAVEVGTGEVLERSSSARRLPSDWHPWFPLHHWAESQEGGLGSSTTPIVRAVLRLVTA
jgi:hypothetical protein